MQEEINLQLQIKFFPKLQYYNRDILCALLIYVLSQKLKILLLRHQQKVLRVHFNTFNSI